MNLKTNDDVTRASDELFEQTDDNTSEYTVMGASDRRIVRHMAEDIATLRNCEVSKSCTDP